MISIAHAAEVAQAAVVQTEYLRDILMWFVGAQAIGLLGVAGLAAKLIQSAITRYEERLDGRIDDRIAALPSEADIVRIHDRIDSIANSISHLEGKSHTLDLIHEFLLKGNRK